MKDCNLICDFNVAQGSHCNWFRQQKQPLAELTTPEPIPDISGPRVNRSREVG